MRVKSWEEFYASPRSLTEMFRWAVTHSRLVSELVEHPTLLEVGTGTGMLSSLVSKFCERTVTVDTSSKVLDTARVFMAEVGARVLPVRGDAFRLPFRDGSFSACFSQGLFEHFSDADIHGLVAEQLRVSGIVYISVPSMFYPHVGRLGPGLVGNERLLTLGRWCSVLARWNVTGEYYADPKIASFGGRTLPWPAQILLRVRGGSPRAPGSGRRRGSVSATADKGPGDGDQAETPDRHAADAQRSA